VQPLILIAIWYHGVYGSAGIPALFRAGIRRGEN
jgi:hypothetical protein